MKLVIAAIYSSVLPTIQNESKLEQTLLRVLLEEFSSISGFRESSWSWSARKHSVTAKFEIVNPFDQERVHWYVESFTDFAFRVFRSDGENLISPDDVPRISFAVIPEPATPAGAHLHDSDE